MTSSRMAALLDELRNRRALKVISGLNNFDERSVETVVRAAQLGGATLVDIAAD
ncbi:MAG: DUF561 domain-containing protein, partial [Cyanobacteria bacterium J06648_11]